MFAVSDRRVAGRPSQDHPGKSSQARRSKVEELRRKPSKSQPMTDIAVKSIVKSILHEEQELKFFDTSQALVNLSTAWTIFQPLTNPAQGDTDSLRDGDRLKPHSITLHYQFVASQIASQVRIIVFRWKPNNTAIAPAVASIIITAAGQQSPLGNYNRDLRDQYTILYDENHPMGVYVVAAGTATVATAPTEVVQRVVFDKRHPAIQFTGGSTSGTNHIYVMACTDDTATQPQIGYVSRMLFTDS